MFRVCSFVLAMSLSGLPVMADVTGPARVIDGDTFDIGHTRIRVFGIDAPEMGQPCVTQDGQRWDCGAWAKTALAALTHGKQVTCQHLDTDRYGRSIARCSVGSMDLGEVLVREGFALAYRRYSMDYDLVEKQAAVAGRGLWGMTTQAPADYRLSRSTQPSGAQGCVIKGNISGSGRIYHMPGQEHYARTRINTASGERWFCSEEEARAAGWRRARR